MNKADIIDGHQNTPLEGIVISENSESWNKELTEKLLELEYEYEEYNRCEYNQLVLGYKALSERIFDLYKDEKIDEELKLWNIELNKKFEEYKYECDKDINVSILEYKELTEKLLELYYSDARLDVKFNEISLKIKLLESEDLNWDNYVDEDLNWDNYVDDRYEECDYGEEYEYEDEGFDECF
jgi:hypothetical protein